MHRCFQVLWILNLLQLYTTGRPVVMLDFDCSKRTTKCICAIVEGAQPAHGHVLALLPHCPGPKVRLSFLVQHRDSGRTAGCKRGGGRVNRAQEVGNGQPHVWPGLGRGWSQGSAFRPDPNPIPWLGRPQFATQRDTINFSSAASRYAPVSTGGPF